MKDLRQDGYCVLENALPDEIAQSLLAEVTSSNIDYRQANIGRAQDHQLNQSIRSDAIKWINKESPAETLWVEQMENLRLELNKQLFLGLFSYESHFAHYPIGAFYKTHVDAFHGQANRMLSTVYYLNPEWSENAGGELVIYNPENHQEEIIRVQPKLGTLVIFLSEEFPHQVLPATRPRQSIAGWFRVNNSSHNKIDPPE